MGRKRMPDGRRTVVGVRLSDGDCERLDALRGEVSRTAFAYAALRAALRDGEPPGPDALTTVPPQVLDGLLASLDEPGEPSPALEEPGEPSPALERAAERLNDSRKQQESPPRRCTHPGVRITGGWCVPCQRTVLPGGG